MIVIHFLVPRGWIQVGFKMFCVPLIGVGHLGLYVFGWNL